MILRLRNQEASLPSWGGRHVFFFFFFLKAKVGQVHSWGLQTSSPLPGLTE